MNGEIVTLRNKKTGEIVKLRRKTITEQPQIQQPQAKPTSEQLSAQRIQARPSAVQDLIKNPLTMKHPLGAILRTLAGGAEYYQGVPASIALDLQRGRPQDILSNLGKVMKGQRPVQYGDVFKGAGLPEPLAAGAGLYTDVMFTPGGAQGTVRLGKGVKSLAKGSISKLKNILKYDKSLKQAQKSQQALALVRKELGTAKDLALQEVSKVKTDFNFKNMPDKVISAIKQEKIYGVDITKPITQESGKLLDTSGKLFTPGRVIDEGGKIKQTLGNLDKIREAAGELLTPKNWKEAPKTEMQQIKMFYGRLASYIKQVAKASGKDISKEYDAYSKFMENYRIVQHTIENAQGAALGNRLKSTFDLLSEGAYKQAWKEVSKHSPEVKSIMNSMQRRSLLKDLLKAGAAYEGGKKLLTGSF